MIRNINHAPCVALIQRKDPTNHYVAAAKSLDNRSNRALIEAMEDLRTKCPECGSALRTHAAGAMTLRKVCSDSEAGACCGVQCSWRGEPYLPKKKQVRTTKTIPIGSWIYEVFNGRGRSFIHSHGFGSKEATSSAAKKEVDRLNDLGGNGKCVAIVWPPTTKVKGTRIK